MQVQFTLAQSCVGAILHGSNRVEAIRVVCNAARPKSYAVKIPLDAVS